jgi:hypothetical protein
MFESWENRRLKTREFALRCNRLGTETTYLRGRALLLNNCTVLSEQCDLTLRE